MLVRRLVLVVLALVFVASMCWCEKYTNAKCVPVDGYTNTVGSCGTAPNCGSQVTVTVPDMRMCTGDKWGGECNESETNGTATMVETLCIDNGGTCNPDGQVTTTHPPIIIYNC